MEVVMKSFRNVMTVTVLAMFLATGQGFAQMENNPPGNSGRDIQSDTNTSKDASAASQTKGADDSQPQKKKTKRHKKSHDEQSKNSPANSSGQ
jgi:hypothetical protein